MLRSSAGTTREEEALAEIAVTRVAPAGAWTLALAFLLLSLTGGTLELAALARGHANLLHGKSALEWPQSSELSDLYRRRGGLAVAERLRDAGTTATDRLERDSRLASTVRPRLQSWLVRRLRYGNSQVLVGDEDWLFFRDDFQHVTGLPFLAPEALSRRAHGLGSHPSPAPDPLPAILGLAADLGARGIGLVVMPVPTKVGIAWERLLGRRARRGPALDNPSKAAFVGRLRAAGVEVFDPTPLLREIELSGGSPPYMQFDSHWSPAGLDGVASGLATFLRARYELGESAAFSRTERTFVRNADLGELLGLDPAKNPYLVEVLQIQSVDGPGARAYSSRRSHGPVLLVGDSFSRMLIRNRRKGGDANFAAALSFHLRSPVAMFAASDAGQSFARRVDWLSEPHVLDEREVVVLEVAERALSLADWQPARLAAAASVH